MIQQIQEWCKQAYDRALKGKGRPSKTNYQSVPKGARVLNRLSNRAAFAACAMRRKGYIVHTSAADLSDLRNTYVLSDLARAILEDNWLRGALWQPPIVKAKPTEDGWVIQSIDHMEIVAFLGTKQSMVAIQIIEPEDVPATKEKLLLLREGLFNATKQYCPILSARITY